MLERQFITYREKFIHKGVTQVCTWQCVYCENACDAIGSELCDIIQVRDDEAFLKKLVRFHLKMWKYINGVGYGYLEGRSVLKEQYSGQPEIELVTHALGHKQGGRQR